MRRRSARAFAPAVVMIGMVGACVSPDVLGTAEAPARPQRGPTVAAGPDPSAATAPAGADAPDPGPNGSGGGRAAGGAGEAAAVYGGLGTWIDIYDHDAWERPAATVRSISQ